MNNAPRRQGRVPYPIEIRRLPEEKLMRVQWSDGHVSEFPFDYLRGWCPCADCQGHSGERHFIIASGADLDTITVAGNYALALTWADGHDTGIYSYRYLREMCPCAVCRSIRGGDYAGEE